MVDPPLKAWIFSKPDVVAIEYHTSFPYVGDPFYLANVPEQDNRVFYNQIFGVPAVRFDGPHQPPQLSPTGYEALYQQRKALGSRVRLDLAGDYDPGNRTGEVTALVIAETAVPGNWRLRVALTESDIHYNAPNGINEHHHVFRRFLPDTTGTLLAFAAPYPDSATVTLPFTLNVAWAAENVAAVAFLQEQGSRQVEQAGAIRVEELATGIGDEPAPGVAAADRIEPIHPNPFNPHAQVTFILAQAGHARLTVHDVLGRRVRTLVDETRRAGKHVVQWDGRDDAGREVGSGVYHFRLTGVQGESSRKAVLLR